VLLVFWCTQCSLNHPTSKSLVVLSQEIGVDTPHSFMPYLSSHSAKCDEHWFYRHHFHERIAIQISWKYMKTCNTFSTLSLSVELRGFQSIPCPLLALFHHPQTCHATLQLLYMLMVVVQINFSNIFACHSHSPFPVSFKNSLTLLKCSNKVLPFCFMLASAIYQSVLVLNVNGTHLPSAIFII
jgi:hypothetical protein